LDIGEHSEDSSYWDRSDQEEDDKKEENVTVCDGGTRWSISVANSKILGDLLLQEKQLETDISYMCKLFSEQKRWGFLDLMSLVRTCKKAYQQFMYREWYKPIFVSIGSYHKTLIIPDPIKEGEEEPAVRKRWCKDCKKDHFLTDTYIEDTKTKEKKLVEEIFCKNSTLCGLSSSDRTWTETERASLVAKRKWLEAPHCFCTKCRCLTEHCVDFEDHVGYGLVKPSFANSGPYRTVVYQKSKRHANRIEAAKKEEERETYAWPPTRVVRWKFGRTWPDTISYNRYNEIIKPRSVDISKRRKERGLSSKKRSEEKTTKTQTTTSTTTETSTTTTQTSLPLSSSLPLTSFLFYGSSDSNSGSSSNDSSDSNNNSDSNSYSYSDSSSNSEDSDCVIIDL
jgi:hypothetical protein